MSKPFKILMFGPAYGHNIQPFIEFFENNDAYDLTFAYSGQNDFLRDAKRVKFVEYSKSPVSLLKLSTTIKKDYDIIWYHGAYELKLLMLIQSFKHKNTKLVLNVWGEHVPRLMLKNDSQGKKYIKHYKKAYIIQCNWFGVQNLLKKNFPEDKLPVLPWGLHKEFFSTRKIEASPITEDFIASIDQSKTNFFYPKSFTEASDHDCIIEAARGLKAKGVNSFCVYFWTGNITRGNFEKDAMDKIAQYGLENLVKVEKHDYLPFRDIKLIWEQMDCGLQISIHDQLSSTLLEPMYMGKELIATNIEPYQILLEKFPDLELLLIERKPEVLSNRMEDFIDGNRTSDRVLKQRKEIVKKEFNFDKNIQRMMDYYQHLLNG
jgi:glycosyltransferase involved in cell wall biosynthesis